MDQCQNIFRAEFFLYMEREKGPRSLLTEFEKSFRKSDEDPPRNPEGKNFRIRFLTRHNFEDKIYNTKMISMKEEGNVIITSIYQNSESSKKVYTKFCDHTLISFFPLNSRG